MYTLQVMTHTILITCRVMSNSWKRSLLNVSKLGQLPNSFLVDSKTVIATYAKYIAEISCARLNTDIIGEIQGSGVKDELCQNCF